MEVMNEFLNHRGMMFADRGELPSGKHTKNYWKWP